MNLSLNLRINKGAVATFLNGSWGQYFKILLMKNLIKSDAIRPSDSSLDNYQCLFHYPFPLSHHFFLVGRPPEIFIPFFLFSNGFQSFFLVAVVPKLSMVFTSISSSSTASPLSHICSYTKHQFCGDSIMRLFHIMEKWLKNWQQNWKTLLRSSDILILQPPHYWTESPTSDNHRPF